MFRKITKKAGRFSLQVLSDVEVDNAKTAVREFNIQAWKDCLKDAEELGATPEGKRAIAIMLFDKLSLQTFSVIKNHADTIFLE